MNEITAESRKRAARVGARVTLLDIRLRRIEAEVYLPAPRTPLNLTTDVEPSLTSVENLAIYEVKYDLSASDADGDKTFDASIVLALAYGFDPDSQFSDDDLTAFGSVRVLFMAHPYVREIAQSLTSRMGLPPLLLEILHSPLDVVGMHGEPAGDPSTSEK